MAEKTYYNGIPDIPADAETKVITEPYKLDPNAKYESDKFLTGEETRRRALVTGSWKLDTGALQYDLPKPLEVTRSIGVAAEDSARHTLAQFVNEVLTSPGKTATGTAIGALTWKALTPVAENALAKTIGTRAASSLLGKIGAGVVGGAAAAGVAGAAGYAFFPTPAGDAIEGSGGNPEMFEYSMKQSHARKAQQTINQATKDFNDKKITQEELDKVTQENQPIIDEFNAVEQKKRQSDVNSVYAKLQNAKNVLEQAKQNLSEGKITQKEFDDRQEFFDRTVSSHLEYAKQLDYFNDAVKMLEGAPYPTQSIAEDIIASTSEFIQNRDFLREIQNIQKGVDPDNVLNVTASTIGRMVPIIATSAFTGRFTRLGRKQFFKSLVNDPEFKTVVFRPVKSAKQAAAAAEKAGLIGTYMQELGDIAWEEKQKYIEETGDVDLINYVPSDDLSKYAYSAAAAQIEFMGGVEPLFAGGLRRALRTGGVRTALKAGALTGAEEIAEEMEQGFSRFLTQKMSGTTDKTWGEGLKEILISMAYAGPIGFGFGSAVHAYGRRQLIKGLTEYGLSPETAAKVADNMIDQVETANNPQLETVRDNLRSKIAVLYEDKDLSEAEKEDAIETQTDLEMSWLVTEAAEKGYAPEESPLLQGVVNEIGYFRTGIPEQIADDVARLNNEIADLRQQLRDENAKEQKDFNKIEELESKIEQFYAKLPQDIANIVETDRAKVRQMLSEQSERAMDISNRRKIASQVRQRALRAMQKQDESELQQSLRRLQEQTRKEESEARAEERKQRTEQRKLRRAIEKMRQNVLKRKERMPAFQEMFADPDLVYKALRDSGFTDEQIATMPQDDIVKAVLPYGISQQILKQSDLAAENARLDDIYPAYDGETIEVDGKERTVYNSNGDRIAKSKEALTNFWRWFGDSKVVDEQGRPLVVYHGTPSGDFDTFYEDSYFTADKEYANSYQHPSMSATWTGKKTTAPKTFAVYLQINNPFTTTEKTAKDIFEKEYTASYAPVLAEDGNVDWTEAQDLIPFIKEQHPEYDGILLSEGGERGISYVPFEPNQIKSVDNRGTYSSDTGNIYKQTKVSGKGKDFRGFYVPDYRLIVLSPDADVTTLTHEFAHDWLQQFFRHYRSGKASESFMKSWGAVEKALGISPDAITVPDEASEAFARAYEGWVLNKKDWAKNIDVDDENREQLIERFKRYQEYLTDIYEDLTNPYFRETWGKVGELKPELQAWFEQVTMADDVISAKVASGAITPEQAQIRTISKNVNDVVQAAEDNFTQKEKDEINAVERLNDTSRYEVPGGNKNSLQNRLSGLARDIDANNVALGRYDTHRDMLEVAKAADEFVRTRTDEALNIINGIEPEKEGLYASDLYTALERFATETNNVDLAMELINSKVAQDLAKEWGQRVAGFRNFTGDGDFDAISQLKALDNQYKKDYDEKEKQKVNTAADEYVTELNNADDAQDVDAFLDSIKCQ